MDDTGRPIPSPSYNLLEASSRGESNISWEVEERGVVVGEELEAIDFSEEPDECVSASASSSIVLIATVGKGWDTMELKRSGCGRDFNPLLLPKGEKGETWSSSAGGGVTLRLGEETARLAPRTELLFPPRLQEETASDLEGVAT